MPVAYIDIPTGVNDVAKEKNFNEMYEAIHEAWPIPDTRVLIRVAYPKPSFPHAFTQVRELRRGSFG